jgi:hypothetical protein
MSREPVEFTVSIPHSHKPERHYAANVLLVDMLGLSIEIVSTDDDVTRIETEDGKCLEVADAFLGTPDGLWLMPDSLPTGDVSTWEPRSEGVHCSPEAPRLPLLFPCSKAERLVHAAPNAADPTHIRLNLDVFGTAFFMLSRYEECIPGERDVHGRFPFRGSVASRTGTVMRPIVNEYVNVLWWCMQRLWPGLRRKARDFRVLPTHDVDRPYAFATASEVIRRAGGDLQLRHNPRAMLNTLFEGAAVLFGSRKDPFDTYDWIMSESEHADRRSTFNFKAGGATRFDKPYALESPEIAALLTRIQERGHKIGFHPSYEAGEREEVWREEDARLRGAVNEPVAGGRQHYLRFSVPQTWRLWESAGYEYESTLGFASHIGFRCGICHEYPVFDLVTRQPLALRERPLVVMDQTLFADCYMNLDSETAREQVEKAKATCRKFNGDFTFLWHNSELESERNRDMYRWLVS